MNTLIEEKVILAKDAKKISLVKFLTILFQELKIMEMIYKLIICDEETTLRKVA